MALRNLTDIQEQEHHRSCTAVQHMTLMSGMTVLSVDGELPDVVRLPAKNDAHHADKRPTRWFTTSHGCVLFMSNSCLPMHRLIPRTLMS